MSVFDNYQDISPIPNSHETAVWFELAADETGTIPSTIREISPKVFPQAYQSCDWIDKDDYMEPDSDLRLERPSPTPTNPRSTKYDLRHNPKLNCNDDSRD